VQENSQATIDCVLNRFAQGHLPMLRAATLLISALLLSACVTQTPSDVVFPAAATPAAAGSAQAAPAEQSVAQAAPTRPVPAGRAARAPDPAPAAPASSDDGPMTVNKAREQCWMKSESNNAIRNDLDKKVKFVEQCVNEKMK
jgi:hypothetical protein